MRKRQEKKDRRLVKAWMVLNEIRPIDIQHEVGLQYGTQVFETLRGIRDDRKVLAWLRDKGCPIKYLKLPLDMEVSA